MRPLHVYIEEGGRIYFYNISKARTKLIFDSMKHGV